MSADGAPAWTITADDPRRDDVAALLAQHLAFAHTESPPEDVHALDVDALVRPGITFFGARDRDGALLGVGALQQLDASHAEIKSMHTARAARGRGVARAMLAHLLDTARARGCTRVSLETGATPGFVPARGLYAAAGFTECEPYGSYFHSPYSVCMTLELEAAARAGRAPESRG